MVYFSQHFFRTGVFFLRSEESALPLSLVSLKFDEMMT